ncbi:MAG: efflux RND transporter periplasmic adaptor subunit [Candidatus Electrothrix sp. AR3]|nr:efflux RND transporter periplasmic adaptor subunit [Candidatus Electrothrix sp. AR3]
MKIFFKTVLALLILTLAVGAAWQLYHNKPRARKAKPKRPVPVVKAITIQADSEAVLFEASGTVIPAKILALRSEVEGRIIEQNAALVPGGIIRKGELLIRIDPQDYQFQIRERQAELATAQYELEVEQGKQTIARQEWQILEKEVSRKTANQGLALRKPHLQHARARLEAAKSRLEAAKLAQKRTAIRAPFTGIVLEEAVEKGQFIGRQSAIATLVATDAFWVQVSVPLSLLKRIQFPDPSGKKGSTVDIIQEQDSGGQDIIHTGTVFKLLGDLDPKGRMARLLVTVLDPFDLAGKEPTTGSKILLGSFVKMRINAGQLDNVYVIPSRALREGNRLWLVNDAGVFDSREVRVRWRRIDEVLVETSIAADERVITSRLQSPIPGMLVREEGAKPLQKKNE